MNIHITNYDFFKSLQNSSLISCQFGSFLYKTNDEFSDKDIHYIYTTSTKELNSFLKSHHHLQYKENGVDHIFVNLHTFLSNLIKGDSTVLFELIFSDSFINTPLQYLYDNRNWFISYTIIRAYLGFCRRDIQFYHKKETHREQIKAIGHIYRGYYFAKSLMEGNFSLINNEFLQFFKTIKQIGEIDFKSKKVLLNEAQKLVSDLRDELNDKFNNNKLNLPKYILIENQILIDNFLNELMSKWEFKKKQDLLNDFNMEKFYEAFENDINY